MDMRSLLCVKMTRVNLGTCNKLMCVVFVKFNIILVS